MLRACQVVIITVWSWARRQRTGWGTPPYSTKICFHSHRQKKTKIHVCDNTRMLTHNPGSLLSQMGQIFHNIWCRKLRIRAGDEISGWPHYPSHSGRRTKAVKMVYVSLQETTCLCYIIRTLNFLDYLKIQSQNFLSFTIQFFFIVQPWNLTHAFSRQ